MKNLSRKETDQVVSDLVCEIQDQVNEMKIRAELITELVPPSHSGYESATKALSSINTTLADIDRMYSANFLYPYPSCPPLLNERLVEHLAENRVELIHE